MRRRHGNWRSAVLLLLALVLAPLSATGGERTPSAERGYQVLTSTGFVPADFDEETFAQLWTVWPEPHRSQAAAATPAERRRMAFSRYGLIESPDHPGTGPALGYLDDGQGGWVMNCLACHGGKVAGQVIPGLANTHTALQTLTAEVRLAKFRLGKPLAHLDLATLKLPLNTTNGTTNSVIFGVVLGALRDKDMVVDTARPMPALDHHDLDAPPFWNVKKKTSLYCDGFAPKAHRPLMQFMLLPRNSPQTLQSWEDDFRDILAWIESVEPPAYPWEIESALAEQGRRVFEHNCARCHGTYGPDGRYEQQVVALDELGTDPVRLHALTPAHREWMKVGWLSDYGREPVETEPAGYVAPPLDGIWASAPYFHNGSVPTLWHVLYSDQRPRVWKRTEEGYDRDRTGLEVAEFDEVPPDVTSTIDRRWYFDTRLRGKSAAGHDFPDVLTEAEKRAVLEYLKTL